MKPFDLLMAHLYSEKHNREAGMIFDFIDFQDKELLKLISELEVKQRVFELVYEYLGDQTDDNFMELADYVNSLPQPPEQK